MSPYLPCLYSWVIKNVCLGKRGRQVCWQSFYKIGDFLILEIFSHETDHMHRHNWTTSELPPWDLVEERNSYKYEAYVLAVLWVMNCLNAFEFIVSLLTETMEVWWINLVATSVLGTILTLTKPKDHTWKYTSWKIYLRIPVQPVLIT